MPSNSFDRDVLKAAVAQICHSLGWNSMQKSSLSVLTDVLERYMKTLSRATAGFCHNSCRTDINLGDLGIAFDQLGIQLCELEDYVHQVEPIHFPKTVPQFQSGTSSAIQFPTGKELTSRGEWYDDHMPTLGSSFKGGETDIKVKDAESVSNEIEETAVPAVDKTDYPSFPFLDNVPNKRHEDNSFVETKSPWDNKLCLPNLLRPELPRFKSIESPLSLKQSSLPYSTPTTPILPIKREGSPLKSLERKSPVSSQDKVEHKDLSHFDGLSPKPAKRAKVLSPPLQSDNVNKKSKQVTPKEVSKRPEALPLGHQSQDSNRSVFSPRSTDSISSPVSKPQLPAKSPSLERVPDPQKLAGTPFLEWPHNQPSPKLELATSLSDKKSKAKKAKKVKKPKSTPPSKGSSKSKQNSSTPFSSSPQLFGSPHVLKSPPEQRIIIASQANTKGSPKIERKADQNFSPYREKTPTTPEIKAKSFQSTPHQEDVKYAKDLNETKKQPTKKAKKHSKASVTTEMKEKSPLSVPERPQLFASLPVTKISKHDEFRSPSSSTSPGVKSSTFNVTASLGTTLNSPEYKTPENRLGRSSKAEKKTIKKEEKKRKKDKKNKKKPTDEESAPPIPQKAKNDTPSLKLTFKRAPSGTYNEQHTKDASPTLKVRGLSPPTAFPVETPAYPFQPSPTKVLSPPSEPKPRKSKKVKTSAKAKKPDLLERRPEPAVRIEPLVINETFDAPDYTESYELTKEPEAKPIKTAKKDGSGKKSKPSKKADSGKKVAKKKPEATKKPAKSKPAEVYQPDQYYSSPPPVTLTGEQSISRGLFIQTITEPPTTQVWYCPSCLRPDDGSPMIGCDSCDGWYHWTCVGITQAPSEDVEWYCGTCVDRLNKKKIKKRKKKD